MCMMFVYVMVVRVCICDGGEYVCLFVYVMIGGGKEEEGESVWCV